MSIEDNKIVTPREAEMLRKAVARAKQFPKGLSMTIWVTSSGATPCGAVGCLAFEILAANTDMLPSEIIYMDIADRKFSISDEASKLLGIESMGCLFRLQSWPNHLCIKYNAAIGDNAPEIRVQALEEAVELFIMGDGKFPEEVLF